MVQLRRTHLLEVVDSLATPVILPSLQLGQVGVSSVIPTMQRARVEEASSEQTPASQIKVEQEGVFLDPILGKMLRSQEALLELEQAKLVPSEHRHQLEVAFLVAILNKLSPTQVVVSLELRLRTSQQQQVLVDSLVELQRAPAPVLDSSVRLKQPTPG